MPPLSSFDLDTLKGADLAKGADLDDTGKGADLDDTGKGADLTAVAAAVDRGLMPLERLLGKLTVAMAAESEPTAKDDPVRLTPDERRMRAFTSDNGGMGIGDVLADLRGYVDDLRSRVTRLKNQSKLAGPGITIQVFVAPKS